MAQQISTVLKLDKNNNVLFARLQKGHYYQ